MSDTSTPPNDTLPQEATDPLSDPLAMSLAIEREKLKLERERLAIERDKLEADLEDFEIRMADAPDPEELTFGVSAICVVAAVCLLLGGIIGFSTGMDIGRSQSPKPRKIQVSRKFVDMMASVQGKDRTPAREEETPVWQRLRRESKPTSVIIYK
ncbi:MAG: hypothetical protein ACOX9C_05835 [Kiritimatiellia bacterium]|jgi:hypothetical protein